MMMITAVEFRSSLAGLWRLMRFDARGVEAFDLSRAGAWRSFALLFYVLPIAIVLNLYISAAAKPDLPFFEAPIALVYGFQILLNWFLFPVVAWHVLRAQGMAERFAPYITVLNWARLMPLGFYMLLMLALMIGLPMPLIQTLSLLVGLYVLALSIFIIRTVLNAGLGLTISLILLMGLAELMVAIMMESALPPEYRFVMQQLSGVG